MTEGSFLAFYTSSMFTSLETLLPVDYLDSVHMPCMEIEYLHLVHRNSHVLTVIVYKF